MPGGGHEPSPGVVPLAYDKWLIRAAVERVLHQPLKRRVLLLDDQHFAQPDGELAEDARVDRHRHAQVQEPDAGACDGRVVAEAEQPQRLAQLAVRVAARRDPDPRIVRVHADRVQLVLDRVLPGDGEADVDELLLELKGGRGEQPARGMREERLPVDEERRHDRTDPVEIEVDGARAVGHAGNDLHATPQPRRAGQGDAVAAKVERLLHITRVNDWHVEVDQRCIGRRRERGGLRARIIADERKNPAVAVRSGEHGVADRVVGSVEARCLGVPNADHAVAVGLVGVDLNGELAAHHRSCGELLVEAGLGDEAHPVGRGDAGDASSLPIEAGQWRSGVPAHERPGPAPRGAVDAQLLERDAGEGLDPRHQHPTDVVGVPVVESVTGRARSNGGLVDRGRLVQQIRHGLLLSVGTILHPS